MPSFISNILDLLFPDRCGGCKRLGTLFCDRCRASLHPYPEPVNPLPPGLSDVQIAYIFDGPLREALHQLKYRRVRRVAQPLGALLAAQIAAQPLEQTAIIAVPLHAKRLSERGFNQAALLAEAVAIALQQPLLDNHLVRVRATEQQVLLNTAARMANIQGAFEWRGAPITGRVLLIDDVMTTGATMSACAQVLRAAGAEHVYGLALARSLPDRPGNR